MHTRPLRAERGLQRLMMMTREGRYVLCYYMLTSIDFFHLGQGDVTLPQHGLHAVPSLSHLPHQLALARRATSSMLLASTPLTAWTLGCSLTTVLRADRSSSIVHHGPKGAAPLHAGREACQAVGGYEIQRRVALG